MKKFNKKSMSTKESSTVQPKNSFLTGLGSIFNISGKYFEYNTSKSAQEADSKALRKDWEKIGKDIKEAEDKIKFDNKDLCLF